MATVTMTEMLLKIQSHLTSGSSSRVAVGTHTRTTIYASKHVDMFRIHGDELQVQHGKRWDTLGNDATGLLVSIRLGEYK